MISLSRVWSTVVLLAITAACSGRGMSGVEQSVRAGDERLAQKRYAEAIEAYRQARDADPDNQALRAKLGEAYLLSGDAVRAADLLPADAMVQVRAAAQELLQGRFDDAARRMDSVLRGEPDHVLALIQHANALAHLWDSGGGLFVLARHADQPAQLRAALAGFRQGALNELDVKAEAEFRRALSLAPEMPEAQVALANFLVVKGRVEEAEAPLRAFADQQPGHAPANHALGAFYRARQRDGEAMTYLTRAAAVPGELGRGARLTLVQQHLADGRDADARQLLDAMQGDDASGDVSVHLAALDARAGRPADAVRRIDDVLRRVPSQAAGLLLKAQVLSTMGNPDLRHARAAVSAAPTSSAAHALLGAALAEVRDYEAALPEYGEAVKLDPASLPAILGLAEVQLELGMVREAVFQAREAVRRAPESKDAVLLLVRVLARQNDYEGAERALFPLRTRFPNDPDVETPAASLLAARGNSAAARGAFLRVLQHAPGSIDALSGLVSIELGGSVTSDTQARVEEALARHPRDPRVLLLAGQLHAAANDLARAESTLRRAFALDPGNVNVAQELSGVLKNARRFDEAAAVLTDLLGRRPRARHLRASLAALLEQAGKPQDARAVYERIVEDDPEARDELYRLVQLYLSDKTTWQQAENLALAARRRWPDDARGADLLGQTYTLRGLSREAVRVLRSAVASAPANAGYRYHLAAAYERAGSLSEARAEYARALELDPSAPDAARARAFLAGRR